MNRNIKRETFADVNLEDPFFDSLKADYSGFETWFNRDLSREAYVLYDDFKNIQGFLHLKIENKIVEDVTPMIVAPRILKVGTFKVDAHGTKMGEQFIKIIMDNAVEEQVDVCYVTVFQKQGPLINLMKSFGFEEHGTKGAAGHNELVLLKDMRSYRGNVSHDYPLINTTGCNKYLLAIYPQYHSVMFPDSLLKTESGEILTDISHTNSIHKIYVCSMDVDVLKYGDVVVVYRTAEPGRSAEYSSVVTSVCVVEEVLSQHAFKDFDTFYAYAGQYSVFDKDDLYKWYKRGKCRLIKMTYNLALPKRITRHDLIEKVGISREDYWGFMSLTDEQFNNIVAKCEAHESVLL